MTAAVLVHGTFAWCMMIDDVELATVHGRERNFALVENELDIKN